VTRKGDSVNKQVELKIAKPSIMVGLNREILRVLDENRNLIVKRAIMPKRAIIFVEPDEKVLNEAYAMFDREISSWRYWCDQAKDNDGCLTQTMEKRRS